jgi:hypothetical protein
MRIRLVLFGAVSVALVGTTATSIATASPHPAAAAPATQSVIVRPVTSAGQPASGFHVKVQHGGSIDCGAPPFPSPGAVDRNIEECSPSAAYAIACWKAAEAHHALCLRNPSSHRLYRIRLTRSFAKTPAVKAKLRAPLLIVLTDGTRCTIRDGGAWSILKSHPKWFGSYSCSRHGVVWSPPHSKRFGVNESAASWSVHTGSAAGTGKLTVRHVKTAYFVGTATATATATASS